MECCDKALEIDPKFAMAWNNKSIVLVQLGKYNEAMECCDKALEINPKDVLAMEIRDTVFKLMEKEPCDSTCNNT